MSQTGVLPIYLGTCSHRDSMFQDLHWIMAYASLMDEASGEQDFLYPDFAAKVKNTNTSTDSDTGFFFNFTMLN